MIGAPGYDLFSAACFNPVPSVVFGGPPGALNPQSGTCTERIIEQRQ